MVAAGCASDDSPGATGAGDDDTGTPQSEGTSSTSDESTTETTAGSQDDSSSGPGPMLAVDCNAPPAAAVGASWSHTPVATGASDTVLWSIEGLPAGLGFNPAGGTMYGTPEVEGSFDVEITASDDDESASTTCTIVVGAALAIDLDALGKPCVEPGDDIAMFTTGGDGASLVCGTPDGSGNGTRPPGITVNPDTCMIEGAIEDGYGTWVWITAVEQSGHRVYVPYCATQDVLPEGWYTIDGDHSGQIGNFLAPKVATFAPGEPVAIGGSGDPVIRVTGPCGPNSCYYGLAFGVGASPFDEHAVQPVTALQDGNGTTIGFTHEISATGPAVSASFETRPWVLTWNLRYCISTQGTDCADAAAIDANGTGSLRFATIMMPQ